MVVSDAFFFFWIKLLVVIIHCILCPPIKRNGELFLEIKISFISFCCLQWSRERRVRNFLGKTPATHHYILEITEWRWRFSLSTLCSHEIRDKETVSLWTQGWGHTFKIIEAVKIKENKKLIIPPWNSHDHSIHVLASYLSLKSMPTFLRSSSWR